MRDVPYVSSNSTATTSVVATAPTMEGGKKILSESTGLRQSNVLGPR